MSTTTTSPGRIRFAASSDGSPWGIAEAGPEATIASKPATYSDEPFSTIARGRAAATSAPAPRAAEGAGRGGAGRGRAEVGEARRLADELALDNRRGVGGPARRKGGAGGKKGDEQEAQGGGGAAPPARGWGG